MVGARHKLLQVGKLLELPVIDDVVEVMRTVVGPRQERVGLRSRTCTYHLRWARCRPQNEDGDCTVQVRLVYVHRFNFCKYRSREIKSGNYL
jgi:hypothetical protein